MRPSRSVGSHTQVWSGRRVIGERSIASASLSDLHMQTVIDTELSVLLMATCGRGALPDDEQRIAIPADVRLMHYGIGCDTFPDACRMLRNLRLLDVVEPGRHVDGKVMDYHKGERPQLHRLKLLQLGFEQSAVEALRRELEYQLSRSSQT